MQSCSLQDKLFLYACFPFLTSAVRRHPLAARAMAFAAVAAAIVLLSSATDR